MADHWSFTEIITKIFAPFDEKNPKQEEPVKASSKPAWRQDVGDRELVIELDLPSFEKKHVVVQATENSLKVSYGTDNFIGRRAQARFTLDPKFDAHKARAKWDSERHTVIIRVPKKLKWTVIHLQ